MSLTLEEIFIKKQNIENDIKDLVNKFEKETETSIIAINMHQDQVNPGKKIICIKLRTGLEL